MGALIRYTPLLDRSSALLGPHGMAAKQQIYQYKQP